MECCASERREHVDISLLPANGSLQFNVSLHFLPPIGKVKMSMCEHGVIQILTFAFFLSFFLFDIHIHFLNFKLAM